MPTLPEILSRLSFITFETALLGLFITAGLILITRDWRFLILALLSQYILIGLILSRVVRPDIAVLEVLIGAFVCPILFLSARQVSVAVAPVTLYSGSARLNRPGNPLVAWWQNFSWRAIFTGVNRRYYNAAPTGLPFRVLVALVMLLATTTLSSNFPLPELAPSITTAIYWLVLVGLATLTVTEDPLKGGHGLFTALTGFGLYYATLETSLLLTGLWGSVNLLIALAVGYLTVVKGAGPGEES